MSQWIAGIARGHNAGVCLLKDGEIVFIVEEERLTRKKYDGGPYASMVKILEYTDKLDYLVIAHTQSDESRVDFSGENVYHCKYTDCDNKFNTELIILRFFFCNIYVENIDNNIDII